MRTARPVPAPFGSGSAASQPLRDAHRRGGRSTHGFRRSIMPEELRGDAPYLRSRIWLVHLRGCGQVLDAFRGESGGRRGEVKMTSRENAGPKFSAGEVAPRLERTRMGDIVGAGKRGDRTSHAIVRIDCIPRNERKVGP